MSRLTFCKVTLEPARTIAQGRGADSMSNTPVLQSNCGQPVAGMALLERPNPAGYFIFPDLSIRHEGKYRLHFVVFETLKDPNDIDHDDHTTLQEAPMGGMGFGTQRVDVRSVPFTVYSAKKFPGLSESTMLSKTVSEQGCRVRIRRDVRMRRRENKAPKEWDGYEEENNHDARRTATPDNYVQQPHVPHASPALDNPDRPRSVSNASNTSFPAPRRPSMEDMNQGYAPNSYSSMPPPQAPAYSQMPQYASGQNQYQGQYTAPAQPAALMQPPQTPYTQPHQAHHGYQSQNGMAYGYMNQTYQQSHYEQAPQYKSDTAVQTPVDYAQPTSDYRRTSVAPTTQQYTNTAQHVPPYSPMDQYGRPSMSQQMSQPQTSHMPPAQSLTPLRTLPPASMPKPEVLSPSYQSPPSGISAPMSAASDASASQHSYDTNRQALPRFTRPQAQPQSVGLKRGYETVFGNQGLNERLQQGQRPQAHVFDDGSDCQPEQPLMNYRRADGSMRQRMPHEMPVS